MKIKDLSSDLRPRERLQKQGSRSLSNSELLAIILGQGSGKDNVLEISNRLLNENNLKSLSRKSVGSLKKTFGVGEAKACQIVACFELGRRLASLPTEKKQMINSAKDIYKLFSAEMSTLKKEHFKGVYLDSRKRIIKEETIFVGDLNTTVFHPREIFEPAIVESAAGIIIVHNHPSGDSTPSKEDIEITNQLISVGKILGIEIVDHVIIGHKNYCSLIEGHFKN